MVQGDPFRMACDALRRVDLLGRLPEEHLQRLAHGAVFERHRPGAVLLPEADAGRPASRTGAGVPVPARLLQDGVRPRPDDRRGRSSPPHGQAGPRLAVQGRAHPSGPAARRSGQAGPGTAPAGAPGYVAGSAPPAARGVPFAPSAARGSLLVLVRGLAGVLVRAPAARRDRPAGQVMLALVWPGELIGEIALLDTGARPVTICAHSDVEVLRLSGSAVAQCLLADPLGRTLLLRHLVGVVRRLTVQSASHLVLTPQQRLAGVLCDMLGRLGDPAWHRDRALVVPRLTQDEFAQLVGVTRQRANRLLLTLEGAHAAIAKDRVLAPDVPRSCHWLFGPSRRAFPLYRILDEARLRAMASGERP